MPKINQEALKELRLARIENAVQDPAPEAQQTTEQPIVSETTSTTEGKANSTFFTSRSRVNYGRGVVCVLLLCLAHCSANEARAAMMDLYNSTDGPNWSNNNKWGNNSVTPCKWFGVTCDESECITELSLNGALCYICLSF
jgi:hypothetical protein